MKKISILAVLLCTACSYSRPLYMDEYGQMVYEAGCDGEVLSIGDCYKKAREDCPNGFEVKDKVASEWVGSRKLIYSCRNNRTLNTQYQTSSPQYQPTQYYRYK
ncbi:MAG: hypothetical protein IKW58_03180 [Alphaproteobacteria bacterium]|nr:hypothetical protein [Alphaproteobacteria bacterium]